MLAFVTIFQILKKLYKVQLIIKFVLRVSIKLFRDCRHGFVQELISISKVFFISKWYYSTIFPLSKRNLNHTKTMPNHSTIGKLLSSCQTSGFWRSYTSPRFTEGFFLKTEYNFSIVDIYRDSNAKSTCRAMSL